LQHLLPLREFVLRPDDPAAIAGAVRQVLRTTSEMSYEPIVDLAWSFIRSDPLPSQVLDLLHRIPPVYLFHSKRASARHVVSDVIGVICRQIQRNRGSEFAETIFLLHMLSYARHLSLSAECRKAMEAIESASRHNDYRDHEHLLFWRFISAYAALILERRSEAGAKLVEIFRSLTDRLPTGLPAYISSDLRGPIRDNRFQIATHLVEILVCRAGCLLMDQHTPEAACIIKSLTDSIPSAARRSPVDPPQARALYTKVEALDVLGKICSEAEGKIDACKGSIDAVVSLPLWGAEHIAFFRDRMMEFWRTALEHAGHRVLLHVLTRQIDEPAVLAALQPLSSLPSVQLLVSRIPEAGLDHLHSYEILRACHNSSVVLAKRADAAVFLMCADFLIDRNVFRATLSKFAGLIDAVTMNALAILSRDMDVVRKIMTAPTLGRRLEMSFETFLKSIAPRTLSYITKMSWTDGYCVVPVETSHFLVILKNRIMLFSPQLHVGALSARVLRRLSYVHASTIDNGFVDRLCQLGLADRIYFIEDFSELRWVQLERNIAAENWQGWGKAKPVVVPDFDMAALSGMIRQSFQTTGRMLALQRPLELIFPGDSSEASAQDHRKKFQRLADDLLRAFPAMVRPLVPGLTIE
jgi:hypothetical protein